MFEFDPHIHSIASGHASKCTITDLAKAAASRNLKMIGITDHGPATLLSARESYFRNLSHSLRKRCGIEILYGAELNILDYNGAVDLSDETLEHLDYAIISMHKPNINPGSIEENTFAYINAMNHPKVNIVGHCDDVKYPVDYEALLIAAMHFGVVLEINNSSLSPDGYRGDTRENVHKILSLCKKHNYPIVLSSDAHSSDKVGDFSYALKAVEDCHFPSQLILNCSYRRFLDFLKISNTQSETAKKDNLLPII